MTTTGEHDDDTTTWKVVGGPGDGRRVLRVALPIAEGQRRQVITPDAPHTALLYQRVGDELHFVESYEIVVFQGGPLDGTTDTLVHLEAQGIGEGEHAVILVDGGRYAWYRRDGRVLVYTHTAEADQVEITEGVGLKIL